MHADGRGEESHERTERDQAATRTNATEKSRSSAKFREKKILFFAAGLRAPSRSSRFEFLSGQEACICDYISHPNQDAKLSPSFCSAGRWRHCSNVMRVECFKSSSKMRACSCANLESRMF